MSKRSACTELAALLEAGFSAAPALEKTAAHQPQGLLRTALSAAARRIQSGATLTDALAGPPAAFDPFERALVNAYERTGRPGEAFRALAARLENIQKVRWAAVMALGYPMAILHAAILLPPIFKFFTEGWAAYARAALLPLAAFYVVIGLAAFGVWAIRRNAATRREADRILLHVPLAGDWARCADLARYFEALAALYDAGVSIAESAGRAANVCRNDALRQALAGAEATIRRGEPLGTAFERVPFIPRESLGLVDAGEKSGRLSDMLHRLAAESAEKARRRFYILAAAAGAVVFGLVAAFAAYVVVGFYADYFGMIKKFLHK